MKKKLEDRILDLERIKILSGMSLDRLLKYDREELAEHYDEKFGVPAIKEYLIDLAKVVAWNIWQMDGIKFVVPNSCYAEADAQLNLFGYVVTEACPGCTTGDHSRHNGTYCRIYDWPANRSVEFYSFIKKGAKRNG